MTQLHERPGDARERPRKQEQEPASPEVTEVAPGVLRMQLPIWMPGLGHVNMYGLVDERGLAVVDPGLPGPSSWRTLKRRLGAAGYRLRDVHTVIVTHSHPDHFGGAGRLAKEAGARLVTHASFTTWALSRREHRRSLGLDEALEVERQAAIAARSLALEPDEDLIARLEAERDEADDPLRSEAGSAARQRAPWGGDTPWGGAKHPMPPLRRRLLSRLLRMLFVPPTPTWRMRHGEVLELAGRPWVALHTPGHTLDHLCLFDPEGGLLLAGDHVLPSITPHISGVGNGADALRSYITTLELVAGLDGVRLGLPAHGHPFDDVPGRVQAIKDHHRERMERIQEVSAALGSATVEQISHEIFPPKHWGIMAESETFAHLEHLVLAGRAERSRGEGAYHYRVVPPEPPEG
ncbi:MAG: MBL fold metallo-hydrolase [Acidimicrobiia bacterium]|nr:MBL fold metallo-hydrolase [Acidimicrobiia bacterium]